MVDLQRASKLLEPVSENYQSSEVHNDNLSAHESCELTLNTETYATGNDGEGSEDEVLLASQGRSSGHASSSVAARIESLAKLGNR